MKVNRWQHMRAIRIRRRKRKHRYSLISNKYIEIIISPSEMRNLHLATEIRLSKYGKIRKCSEMVLKVAFTISNLQFVNSTAVLLLIQKLTTSRSRFWTTILDTLPTTPRNSRHLAYREITHRINFSQVAWPIGNRKQWEMK